MLLDMRAAPVFSGVAFLACLPLRVNACSFSIQRSVKFDAGVASISNRDRTDLAITLIDANNSVVRTEAVVICGIAEERARGGVETNHTEARRFGDGLPPISSYFGESL